MLCVSMHSLMINQLSPNSHVIFKTQVIVDTVFNPFTAVDAIWLLYVISTLKITQQIK